MRKGPKPLTLIQRLERAHRVTETGCWEWTLSTNENDYGQMGVGSRTNGTKTMRKVHQVAWELFRGPVPEGLVLDHVCRNRRCFNPEHLRTCTQAENTLAPGSRSVAAIAASKTHCPQGHPYTGDNLRIDKQGKRVCRTCKAARLRELRRRRRGGL